MVQSVDSVVWDLFSKAQEEEVRKGEAKIQNTKRIDTGSWTDKVVSAIRISDIASENGITECPHCHYDLQFDDGRGWFICVKAKYNGSCDFKGNIVDFVAETGARV